ncbi:MAG: quinone-dependent dihydroorotate dehydrogenase, partial [Burkholderiales bacterium]
LQQPARLDELLAALLETRQSLAADRRAKPLLVKIAPDLAPDDEVAIAEVVTGRGADGLIVGNTTIARPPVVAGRHRGETGGLSGAPLFLRSTEQLLRFHRLTGGKLPLIGVGGILRGADAYAKIRAGASALQLYTALIYRGPNTVVRIVAELERLLERDGIRLSDARGIDAGA